MNWKQQALASLMSDISEAAWCAGWMDSLEFRLWQMVQNPEDNFYGEATVSKEDIQTLKEISDEINGWIAWSEKEGGQVFVSMDEWLENYNEYCRLACPRLSHPYP